MTAEHGVIGNLFEQFDDVLERTALSEYRGGLDSKITRERNRFHGLGATHVRTRKHPRYGDTVEALFQVECLSSTFLGEWSGPVGSLPIVSVARFGVADEV